MIFYPPTKIFRHRRETLKKCSLRGLESRADMIFYPYPLRAPSEVNGYVVLTLDAPVLTAKDSERGLLLLDATWNHAAGMFHVVQKIPGLIYRSLPKELRTAYPRYQTGCSDPERGLASVEALYAAYAILGRDTAGLLDNYYWKEQFIELNAVFWGQQLINVVAVGVNIVDCGKDSVNHC
jgi:rRNA small subunit aminocarboxypropyltransferase